MNFNEQLSILIKAHNNICDRTSRITRDSSSIGDRKRNVNDLMVYRTMVEATFKALLLNIDGAIDKGKYCIHMIETIQNAGKT